MPNKTIQGTLTIPASEPSAGGVYPDLILKLFYVTGSTETEAQFSQVSTSNSYSFTYPDNGQQVKVKLLRVSSGLVLSETATRGVLPRSFLVDPSDPLNATDFIHQNYTYDAGLSVLASAGGRYFSLAKEITNGIVNAEVNNSVPFKVNHVVPVGADAYIRTGTVAMVAYSLGYYLEKKPNAANAADVTTTLYHLLNWLCNKRSQAHGNLVTAGNGQYINGVLDPSFVDDYASTVDNILTFFAFKQASRILNTTFIQVAGDMKASIYSKLYDPQLDYFYAGCYPAGVNVNHSLETKLMLIYFLAEEGDTPGAMDLLTEVEQQYVQVDVVNNLTGYKATINDTNIWYEGTYMTALAYFKVGNTTKYRKLVKGLNKMIDDTDGSFRYGILKDGKYQVLTHKSVGSTAWSFILNMFPEQVFSFRPVNIIATLPQFYLNLESALPFTKDDCLVGTGSTVIYRVLAGTYLSTVSQTDADNMGVQDVTTNGQAYANANGTCNVPWTYQNVQRQAYFSKNNCGTGQSGLPVLYTVPAGMFGSMVSQQDADFQADFYLYQSGQAYANANGSCGQSQYLVTITPSVVSVDNGFSDEVYLTFYSSSALDTFIDIDYDYSLDNGGTWTNNGVVTMFAGATNTMAYFLVSVPQGSGNSVMVRINSVSPNTFGSQVYTFPGNGILPTYQNTQRQAYFSKNTCGAGVQGSIVTYTVPAGNYVSFISQVDADYQADQDIATNGQAYANANGLCPGQQFYYNQVRTGTFQKQGCPAGYDGTTVTYTVPANTYVSLTSVAAANAMADQDIAANGQNYADANGSCTLNGTTIFISTQTDIQLGWGSNEVLYFKAVASSPVTTPITVYYNYEYLGSQYIGGQVIINQGQTESAPEFIGVYPWGEAQNVIMNIWMLNPTQDSGYTYLF